MQFSVAGRQVLLRGLTNFKLVEEGSLPNPSSMGSKGVLLQYLEPELETPTFLLKIINQFSDIFAEPRELPPQKSHDHSIPLLPRTSPISVRPYRHLYYQKDKIEKIVKELLGTRVIQPSQSPYSSPVLLVRKADGSWRLCMNYGP